VIYCSHCGAGNIDDGSFCVRCGSRLGHVGDLRGTATSPVESAVPPQEDRGTEEDSPNIVDTKRPAWRARKRTRWAVLAVALVLLVGGSVTAGVMLHRHGRGPGSSAPATATVHLTAAQNCTLKTLDVTKRLWETPVSDWTSAISTTQQLLVSRYGSGSIFLNAFNAAVTVGLQKAVLDGAASAQIAEMVPVATACGSTHPRTWLGPAPKKKTNSTTTSTTSPPVTPASAPPCTTKSVGNGITQYMIPDDLGSGKSGETALAPAGFTCKAIDDPGLGPQGSGGLTAKGGAPEWVLVSWVQAEGNFAGSLCPYSSYALAFWKSVYGGSCPAPIAAAQKVTFLVGSPSSSVAAIEFESTSGGVLFGLSPTYPGPTHVPQPVIAVLAYDTSQSGLLSFSCTLPTAQLHLCTQDAANFVTWLHLP